MSATLSILGLYEFDNTIFDNFTIPSAMTNSKETLIQNLLLECAELEILFPDPDFMKSAIGAWSASMVNVWTKQYSTTQYDYDPIANYDRHETLQHYFASDGNDTRTPNLAQDTTHGLSTTTAQNSYENAGMVDAERQTNSGKDTVSTTGTDQMITHHTENFTDTRRAYGNIGVTTTQQMIEQERETVLYNMFQIIIDDFKMRFCLLIY